MACVLGEPLGPTHRNCTVSGRDFHWPSPNCMRNGLTGGVLAWVWSLSSSIVAAARHSVGVHEVRNAHQVFTSGGCGVGV
ncbi:Uncharacterised protein [Mycobacterium tuberculosis]|uniref:Uncharacterized protein n=1 Tax=Mycobacterium tuberculosis TaxID=1773 RepID=A0A655FZY2_MYCTX|nr:Uncharacterised protein [Mycobacterium tuberculosis]